jgi:Zn-dependent peptidase ImmA (M78 family)/DNA-binding XRE family transcriptional regulator
MSTLARNLTSLRHGRGWSQEETAKKVGISRVWYANLEGGRAEPTSDTVYALADAFEVQIEELLQEQPQLTRVRFRSSTQLKSRDQVLAHVGRWLKGYREIESLLGDVHKDALPKRTYKSGIEEAKRAAHDIRTALNIPEGVAIRNIGGLLEERVGIRLLLLRVATEGFFGLSVSKEDGGPAIVVNNWERISVERWIFSAAHELGHLVLHLNAYDVAKHDEEQVQEDEANTFAAYFLMPEDQFQKEWQNSKGLPLVDRVFYLKRIFKVSYQTVLMRLKDEIEDVWKRFLVEHKRRTGRSLPRTEEPQALKSAAFCSVLAAEEPQHLVESDLMETRLKTLVRRALDEDLISLSKAAELLGLDLLRMRELANMWVA